MKKIPLLKHTLLQVTFVTALLFVFACNTMPAPADTKEVAEKHNDAKFDSNKQEKDAQFLVNAAEINLEEIQLAQLAQQLGRTAHVKELGKMMEDAHTESQSDLIVLAQSKMITIPTAPTEDAKEAYAELNKKSGEDFDKAYADKMVSEHKDAIADFEKASTDANDTDIKNWASASLPDLRMHLDHALECQAKCEKADKKK